MVLYVTLFSCCLFMVFSSFGASGRLCFVIFFCGISWVSSLILLDRLKHFCRSFRETNYAVRHKNSLSCYRLRGELFVLTVRLAPTRIVFYVKR